MRAILILTLLLSNFYCLGQEGDTQETLLSEIQILNNSVNESWEAGEYKNAIDHQKRIAKIYLQIVGENDTLYSNELKLLSVMYETIKDYGNAIANYHKATDIIRKNHGEHSIQYLTCLSNLGFLYQEQGDYDQAEKYYLMAVSVVSNINKSQAKFFEVVYANLIAFYRKTENLAKRVKYEILLTDFLKASIGESHPDYVEQLGLLGHAYFDSKDYIKAERSILEAITKHKTLFGDSISDLMVGNYKLLAIIYKIRGEYEKSITYQLLTVDATKKWHGEEHQSYAYAVINVGYGYRRAGDYVRAEPYFLEGIRLLENALGKSHESYILGIGALSDNYLDLDNLDEALKYAKLAADISENTFGEKSMLHTTNIGRLGDIHTARGEFSLAELAFQKAVEIRKEMPLVDRLVLTKSMMDLFELYKLQGKYVLAESIYANVNSIIESELDSVQLYQTTGYLNNYAMFKGEQGDYRSALEIYKRLIQSSHHSSDSIDSKISLATAYSNLGVCYMNLTDWENSERSLLQSLGLRKSVFGEQGVPYVSTLLNLGVLYRRQGRLEQSEKVISDALHILEQMDLSQMSRTYITGIATLSKIYLDLGNFSKAEAALTQALILLRDRVTERHPDYIRIEYDLVDLYLKQDRLDRALAYSRSAIAHHTEEFGEINNFHVELLNQQSLVYSAGINGEQHAIKALTKARSILESETIESVDKSLRHTVNNNLADCFADVGQYEKAEALYKSCLDNDPSGTTHNNLGVFYGALGDVSSAEKYLLMALDKRRNRGGKDYQLSLVNLIGLYEKENETSKAIEYLDTLLNSVFSEFRNNLFFLSETEKLAFKLFTNRYLIFLNNRHLGYYDDQPVISTSSYNLQIATKAIVLNSTVEMRKTINNSGDTTALNLYGKWINLLSVISRENSLPRDKRRSDIDSLENKAEKLEKQLSRLSKEFKELGEQVTWDMVQNELAPDEAAIEFSSFRYIDSTGTWSDSTFYVALVLRKGYDHPVMVKLCEEKQLDSLFRGDADREMIADLYRGAVPVGESGPSYGKRLYELLWEPLDTLLREGDHIHFAPSGLLHRIALSAIPYGDSDQLLSDRYKLSRLSTTAKLVTDKDKEEKRPEEIVLFGGIDYDLVPSTNDKEQETYVSRALPMDMDRGNTSWSYLPGTLKETESIATIAGNKKIKVKTYTGTEATEEQIKSLGGKNSPTVLHIASHGFFFPDPERDHEKDRLMQMMGDREQVYRYSDDPLNRAGLLFSGANHTWQDKQIPDGQEDGILTANEATYIPLTNTELVVLSACETGLGEIKGSEGVFGLQRAFKAAGAEYVMMSLWKVPDEETSEFMESFYGHYLSDHTIPDSYHHAQRVMRDKYPNDPYKWAGFVLMR